jgi:hypothetical protein
MVTTGNDISSVLSSAVAGSTVYIKAQNNVTMGNAITLPQNLTLVLDMGGYAMYFTGPEVSAPFNLSNGDHVTFQNENSVSTGTTPYTTGPTPDGTGTQTVYYNTYWGIFYGTTAVTGESLTYTNVVQNFSGVSFGGDGQPFYNRGIAVNFSGTNYFNYSGGQEFMEGNGINVLSGSTTIVHNAGANAIIWADTTPTISVAAGATLNMSGTSSSRGFFYIDNNQPLTITNNGTMTLSMAGSVYNGNDFYSNFGSLSSVTMNFGPGSTTNITSPGFFDYARAGGAFTTTIGADANFTYNTGNASNAFIGSPTTADAFNINGAASVRFNTTKTGGGSIFGTDTAMPFTINAGASNTGYRINGYNSTGASTLTATATTGAYAVNGTFHDSLADLGSLTGTHKPTSAEITTYQNSAQLEFLPVAAPIAAQANFTYAWASDVPGQNGVPGKLMGSLPTGTVSENGIAGDPIGSPSLAAIPAGYTASYKAPNGTVYATLAAAIASVGGVYGGTSNTSTPGTYTPATNDFQVILSAQTQTFYINYGYGFNLFGNSPTYPATYSQTGLTGAVLTLPTLPALQTGYHYSAIRNASGSYQWIDTVNPQTGAANSPTSASLSDALTTAITGENGGLYFGTSSLASAPANDTMPSTNNNYLMAMVTANPEIANYNYQWATSTPIYASLPTLPQNSSSAGGFGDNIAPNSTSGRGVGNSYPTFVAPPADSPLAGYTVSVLAPDGKTYTSDPNATASSTVVKTSTPLATATAANYFKDGTTANNFTITYSPIENAITWTYSYDGSSTGNPTAALPATVNQTVLTGDPLTDPGENAPSGYYISGYSYNGNTYASFSTLSSANPVVTANESISVTISDATALSSRPTDSFSKSTAWTPASDLTKASNGDNTTPTNLSVVNGADVLVTITGPNNYSYSGKASTLIPADTLANGDYTVTYSTLKSDGTTKVMAITQLAVTNFVLPLTGSLGLAGLIGLAATSGLMSIILHKKKKTTWRHAR